MYIASLTISFYGVSYSQSVTYGNQEYISYTCVSVDICDCHHLDSGFLDFPSTASRGTVLHSVAAPMVGPDREGSMPNTITCAVVGLDSV